MLRKSFLLDYSDELVVLPFSNESFAVGLLKFSLPFQCIVRPSASHNGSIRILKSACSVSLVILPISFENAAILWNIFAPTLSQSRFEFPFKSAFVVILPWSFSMLLSVLPFSVVEIIVRTTHCAHTMHLPACPLAIVNYSCASVFIFTIPMFQIIQPFSYELVSIWQKVFTPPISHVVLELSSVMRPVCCIPYLSFALSYIAIYWLPLILIPLLISKVPHYFLKRYLALLSRWLELLWGSIVHPMM